MTVPLENLPDEPALYSFAVLARLPDAAESEAEAVRSVRERLVAADQPFDDLRVERYRDGGRFHIDARFVTVSMDATMAVTAVYESLRAAGLDVEECWVDRSMA